MMVNLIGCPTVCYIGDNAVKVNRQVKTLMGTVQEHVQDCVKCVAN
jgi:hypothetical protein